MSQHAADFETFWAKYPRRVAKLAALKAYQQARRTASQDDILAGVDAYIRHKPAYAEWAHASSWLRAGRWMDEWEAAVVRPPRKYWADECQELHGGTCIKQWDHEMKKRDVA